MFLPILIPRPGGALRSLDAVGADGLRMTEAFRNLGFQSVAGFDNPSAGRLRRELARVLDELALGPHDSLVLYYSGHGEVLEGTHYLCARGFDRDRPYPSGLRTDELVELVLGRTRRPGLLWLILDCCQAGAVLTELTCRALLRFPTGIIVTAAAHGWAQAKDGAFSLAFLRAVRARSSRRQRLVLDDLLASLNQGRHGHPVVQLSVGSRPLPLLVTGAKSPRGPSPRADGLAMMDSVDAG